MRYNHIDHYYGLYVYPQYTILQRYNHMGTLWHALCHLVSQLRPTCA